MIRQNLLTFTEALRRGKLKSGEEMRIESVVSGERFRSEILGTGNRLQERGAVGRFYRDAQVKGGDYVTLEEVSAGEWKLSKSDRRFEDDWK